MEQHSSHPNLRVFCAGWGRTGTHSLKSSLTSYGFKCYSMDEVLENGDVGFWNQMANGDPASVAKVTVHRGYDAVCDFPCSAFVIDFLESYPDAKVVLTIRDENDWYESMKETYLAINPDSDECSVGVKLAMSVGWPALGFPELMHNFFSRMLFRGDFSKQNMIKMYRAHNENIRRLVPPSNLLVLDITTGRQHLGVLSKFLNVPHPQGFSDLTSFPRLNTRADFQSSFITNSAVIGYSTGLLTVGLPYLLWAPAKRDATPAKVSTAVVASAKPEASTGLLGLGLGWL